METPVASGAPGRGNAQVDANTTKTPTGGKKPARPANKMADSYLQRYQEQKSKLIRLNTARDAQDNTEPKDQADMTEDEEVSEGTPVAPAATGISDDNGSGGRPSSAEKSKRSRLCVLL